MTTLSIAQDVLALADTLNTNNVKRTRITYAINCAIAQNGSTMLIMRMETTRYNEVEIFFVDSEDNIHTVILNALGDVQTKSAKQLEDEIFQVWVCILSNPVIQIPSLLYYKKGGIGKNYLGL